MLGEIGLSGSDEGEQDCANDGGDHEHSVHGQRGGTPRELPRVLLDRQE